MNDSSGLLDELAPNGDGSRFFGPWLDKEQAATEFDRRVAASGLFEHVYCDVEGTYLSPRPGEEAKSIRIDRILMPGSRLRDLGWGQAIGVGIEASGAELGPAAGQALDHMHSAFEIDSGSLLLSHVFLWPLRAQREPVSTMMAHNRVGNLCEGPRSPLIFQLEHQVIRLDADGELFVAPSTLRTKDGWQKAVEMLKAYEREGQYVTRDAAEKTLAPPEPAHELLAMAATDTDLLFPEIVVCLGGIFATNDVSDSVVHQVTRGLHRLYLREHCRRFERLSSVEHGSPRSATVVQQHDGLHPAVESLLRQIGR